MVTPYAGVWIEMGKILESITIQSVTPYAGVWIEIRVSPSSVIKLWSLPTRECGLKSPQSCICIYDRTVTPYAGVWIEICTVDSDKRPNLVTPYAGVWIEM